jgi:hypothetical protein
MVHPRRATSVLTTKNSTDDHPDEIGHRTQTRIARQKRLGPIA